MGRPKGSKNRKTLVREALLSLPDPRSDQEIVDDIRDRFDVYHRMITGTTGENEPITSLIVSGSAGVGKSYTAEWVLEHMKQKFGIVYRIIRGTISALDLYELAYEMSKPRHVIVLDDADRIFEDEEGLNILKSLLDTSLERKVNWMTDHPRFKGENALPKEFTFAGAMVFLTNKNFQEYIDANSGKYVEHMNALMSRSIYLDLKMHTRREVALWTRHLVTRNGILRQIGLTEEQEKMLVDWVVSKQNDLRELSIRTAIKLGRLFKMKQDDWERTAQILLLREDPKKTERIAHLHKMQAIAKGGKV